jgi:hypothetical protein
MATPHVTGVVSLMYSINPGITPIQVLDLLQDTAKAFPGGGTCTTSNCGAGIVNAAEAVAGAGKSDLVIAGYQFIDHNTQLPIVGTLKSQQRFGIKILVKNQGGSDTAGVFYRSVYVNRDPSLYIITSPDGCLYNPNIDDNDWGDYRKENFIGGIPAGVTDTNTVVELPGGLPAGVHQMWLYADPTCIVQGESYENNNAYGPITVNVSGSFGTISRWTSSFDLSHGWTVSQYVRTVGDVNGDGMDDLVGFGLDGVYVTLSTGTGFGPISKWTSSFDLSHGWTVADYVRTVGDVDGDGMDDLVGFGLDGVYVTVSTGTGFSPISKWTSSFDLSHGWTVSQYVRTVGDMDGDGMDDLIGFGLDGVYIALAQ